MICRVILKIIKGYQLFLSPVLGRHCRFYPSCSEYCSLVLQKHGLAKGMVLAFWRIVRCNPLNRCGVDVP